MRYRILGQLEVHNGADGVQIGQGRQRLLLAVLLTHANAPVSSERLIDGLWDQTPPPTATRSLHNHVSSLRKALGDGHLVTETRGYRLVVADNDVDASRFDALAEQGRAALAAGNPGQAADRLHEALGLWRGPAFGDLANEPAIVDDAVSLDERRLVAVEDRVDADLELGRHHELVAELDRLVAQHPLRERLRAQQMLARYRSGRQADALDAYRQAREVLVREIGIEPGPELRRLQQAILEQDPALDAPARPAPPPSPAASPAARARRRFAILAGLAAVVALGAFGIGRLAGPDSPEHVEPDAVAVIDP
jgi:DNA-binding SARP family transcriptional activator